MSNNVFGLFKKFKNKGGIDPKPIGAISAEEQEAYEKKVKVMREGCIEYLKSLPHEELLSTLIKSPYWKDGDNLIIYLTITCQEIDREE